MRTTIGRSIETTGMYASNVCRRSDWPTALVYRGKPTDSAYAAEWTTSESWPWVQARPTVYHGKPPVLPHLLTPIGSLGPRYGDRDHLRILLLSLESRRVTDEFEYAVRARHSDYSIPEIYRGKHKLEGQNCVALAVRQPAQPQLPFGGLPR